MNGNEIGGDWRKRSGFLLRRLNHTRPPILTIISSPVPSLPTSRCCSALKSRPSTRFRGSSTELSQRDIPRKRPGRGRKAATDLSQCERVSRCELAFILRETVRLRKKQADLQGGKVAFRETSLRDALVPVRLNVSSRLSSSPAQRCSTALPTPSHCEFSKRHRVSPLLVRIQLPIVSDLVKFEDK